MGELGVFGGETGLDIAELSGVIEAGMHEDEQELGEGTITHTTL